jgi:helicase MOV-10
MNQAIITKRTSLFLFLSSQRRLIFLDRIVKLVKNYRSHPRILDFPNREFYRGDLVACGGNVINTYKNWEHLPKNGFPVIFHAVAGEDMREASSPSYFNVDEITQVKLYVKLLLSDTNIRIGELAGCMQTHR